MSRFWFNWNAHLNSKMPEYILRTAPRHVCLCVGLCIGVQKCQLGGFWRFSTVFLPLMLVVHRGGYGHRRLETFFEDTYSITTGCIVKALLLSATCETELVRVCSSCAGGEYKTIARPCKCNQEGCRDFLSGLQRDVRLPLSCVACRSISFHL